MLTWRRKGAWSQGNTLGPRGSDRGGVEDGRVVEGVGEIAGSIVAVLRERAHAAIVRIVDIVVVVVVVIVFIIVFLPRDLSVT